MLRGSSHNIAINGSRKGQSDGACGWSVVQLQESEGGAFCLAFWFRDRCAKCLVAGRSGALLSSGSGKMRRLE